ncbi:MAG: ribonuclease HII [Mogibacterium sp.]|nr:ribonuclease HII [Mogibacterium sp.]
MTKEERLQRDRERLEAMRGLDNEIRRRGFKFVAGIDEVGRGPLAGPVYAACVVLPEDFDVLGIYDSKKISQKKREELSDIIKEKAVAYGIGIADAGEIDEINILEATKLAMKRAAEECGRRLAAELQNESGQQAGHTGIDYLLVDALKLNIGIPCEAIIKGDEKSLSVAAASIIAKVARDKYMEELDELYPEYGFASNKGYGTAEHYEGLRRVGISDVHRRSFLKKFMENPSTVHKSEFEKAGNAAHSGEKEQKLGKKVYAVRKGKTPGLYMTWDDCKAQVDGFPKAEYRSFSDPQAAMEYLGLSGSKNGERVFGGIVGEDGIVGVGRVGGAGADRAAEEVLAVGVRAYVDGSYDSATGRFSCGVVILETDENGVTEQTELKSVFDDADAAKQRNVAGEIMGAKTAIDYCLANDIKKVIICHDYEGVGKWADGLWKANNPLTKGYKQFMADARRLMDISFEKVKAHAGNKYNDIADKLAKEALGI